MEANVEETLYHRLKSIIDLRTALSKVTSSQTDLNQAMKEFDSIFNDQDVNELIEWINDLAD